MMMRKMSRALKPATSTLEALHPFSQPRRWGTGANTCPRPPPPLQRLRLCKRCVRPGLAPRWVDDDDDDDEGVGFQKRVGGCPSVISVLCLEEDECVRSWAKGGIHEDQKHIPTPWHLETRWCQVGTVPLHIPLFIISKIILKTGLPAFFHHNLCLHCVFGWELALT